MSALTEARIREIIREEIAAHEKRQAQIMASAFVDSAREAIREDPAEPGSLRDEIQQIRLQVAEDALADVLLSEVADDTVDRFPESVDLGFGHGGASVGVAEPLGSLPGGGGTDVADVFSEAHGVSPSLGGRSDEPTVGPD